MTGRKFLPLIPCLGSLFNLWAVAQDSPTDSAVTECVKSEMQRQHIPGLSLLVARNGTIVRAEGFGLSNVELQVPVKPESVFQSGSVGKQLAAMSAMTRIWSGEIFASSKDVPTKPSIVWATVSSRMGRLSGSLNGQSGSAIKRCQSI